MGRVCVIGAGSSGIASCQVLHPRGVPFECFEAGSAVGGNWRYDNDNGMSSAYRSLHANSSRRGMQYGMPADHLTLLRLGTRAPLWAQRSVVALLVRVAQGNVTKYGLPKPGHRLLCSPPTMSDTLLSKLDHGDIVVKPIIERLEGDRAYFTDGSAEAVDVVIYCTGYRISFPFLGGAFGGPISLYRRVIPPNLPGLYFIGLVQPIGAVMPIAEIQSQWVADLLAGRATLPPEPEMNREIARYQTATAKRYRRPVGQAIQVDFLAYVREIRREQRAGARRNGTSRAIAVSPPALRVLQHAGPPGGRWPAAPSGRRPEPGVRAAAGTVTG